MKLDEALQWAERWQEESAHDPASCERAANVFSYVILLLRTERRVALERLADVGFKGESIVEQVIEVVHAYKTAIAVQS